MGPAAQLDPRAPKAPDPLRAHLLKRTNGPKISEWRGQGGSPSPSHSPCENGDGPSEEGPSLCGCLLEG
jgi:hypothetical protein